MTYEDKDGVIHFGENRERRKEGVKFELGGELFETIPEAPAASLLDLMQGIELNDDGLRLYRAPNLIRFVTSVLREEETITVREALERGIRVPEDQDMDAEIDVSTDDVERFSRVVSAKNLRQTVTIEDLGDCAMTLAEKLGGAPFTSSGARPLGRR